MSQTLKLIFALTLIGFFSTRTQGQDSPPEGIASYYSEALEGRSTASGEPFRNDLFTAAHRSLPFNTKVKVTNLTNNKWVVVRINDRGPFVKGRIIDLSRAAAEVLEFMDKGLTTVRLEIVEE